MIRNLKLRIRQDSEHQYNSPWNIAANLALDMSFSAEDIAGMLAEYEGESSCWHGHSADSRPVHDYTSGYPFLVSRLCELMDMVVPGKEGFPDRCSAWTKNGVTEAVKELLAESNPLFDDMVKKLEDYQGTSYNFYPYMTQKGTKVLYTAGMSSREVIKFVYRVEMDSISLIWMEMGSRSYVFRGLLEHMYVNMMQI